MFKDFRSSPAGDSRLIQRAFFYVLCLLGFGLLSACGGKPQTIVVIEGELNDTGIIACANNLLAADICPQSEFPMQDAELGRDARASRGELQKVGGGKAGFDWLKLNSSGQSLSEQNKPWEDDGNESEGSQWSCVHDQVTNLVWEVKASDPVHPRASAHTYSWHSSDTASNGGAPGLANAGSCATDSCDTESYVQWVNAQGLCGHHDWRMPTIAELTSIAVMSEVLMAMDHNYFPNVPEPRFFSAETFASDPNLAWYVYFSDASVSFTDKGSASQVRLVRGGGL